MIEFWFPSNLMLQVSAVAGHVLRNVLTTLLFVHRALW
jgi:hypothetical protein